MVEAVMLKNTVIVAGHPRSGTSLACQVVETSGVKFPSDFGGDQYNKSGYYEMELGKDLEGRLVKEAMTDKNTEDLNTIVRRLNQNEGVSGLKIVRIPAIFYYRHISKNLKAVFIFRHPADVLASMYKRGISAFWPAWFENNNALIAAHENIKDSIVISYESLLDRKSHLTTGFAKVGLRVDLSVIKREEQTQKNSQVYVRREDLELYERLQKIEKSSCK